MTQTDIDIKDIKEKLEILLNHLGIGKTRPADVIEARLWADREVESFVSKKARRKKVPH